MLLISPARDEEATLDKTVRCVESQTLPPWQWVLVDDGSTDSTPDRLRELARKHSWVKVVTRADRGHRKVGGGVIEAFEAGLAEAEGGYDYLAKMDVDLEFPPTYLETAVRYLERDPKMAAISGKVFRPEGSGLVEEYMIDEMVAGQFKLYRRAAFEKIGGFVQEVMWDGIDIHQARDAGLRTASVADPELRIIHLRLMGSSDRSVYRGRLRWGAGQWFMGTSLTYVLASGFFRMREKPYVVGGACIILGYLRAMLTRRPRFSDPRFRQSLRRWQFARLCRLFLGGGAR